MYQGLKNVHRRVKFLKKYYIISAHFWTSCIPIFKKTDSTNSERVILIFNYDSQRTSKYLQFMRVSYFCHAFFLNFYPLLFPLKPRFMSLLLYTTSNIIHLKGPFFSNSFAEFPFFFSMLERSYSWHNSNSLFWYLFPDYHDLHNKAQELGQWFFFWVWRTALYFSITGFSYKHRQFVFCNCKLYAEKRPIGFSGLPKKPMMQNTFWRISESKEKEEVIENVCWYLFILSLCIFFVSESL